MSIDIVIVGGGFAGVATARTLERIAPHDARVTLVNPQNYQLFTPMLPEAAGGAIEPRHIAVALRAGLRRTAVTLGTARSIDVRARTVTLDRPFAPQRTTLRFDHLVLALGAVTSTFGIPGIAEHTLPLKSLGDAARLRAHVGGAFEAAAAARDRRDRDRLLRFAVIGGGFTGVECAGELAGFVRRLHGFYPELRDETPEIVLVEHSAGLLHELPDRFGKRAAASLRRRGVRIELDAKVARADAGGVALADGRRFDGGTVVWTAGVEPAPLLAASGLQTGTHGALVVNADLSVPGLAGVWAAGDCAAIPKTGGGTYAPLAQNAVREGPLLARNIAATLAGRPTAPFRYRRLGMMASLGDRDAVAQLPGRHMIAGFPAWLLWRAYYLTRLPGAAQKLRVAADWTLSGAFANGLARVPWISAPAIDEEDHAAAG